MIRPQSLVLLGRSRSVRKRRRRSGRAVRRRRRHRHAQWRAARRFVAASAGIEKAEREGRDGLYARLRRNERLLEDLVTAIARGIALVESCLGLVGLPMPIAGEHVALDEIEVAGALP